MFNLNIKSFVRFLLVSAIVALCFLIYLLVGRGKEITRFVFNDVIKSDTTFTAQQYDSAAQAQSLFLEASKTYSLWADVSVEYRNQLALDYHIIIQDTTGQVLEELAKNPMDANLKLFSTEINSGSYTKTSFQGRLGKFQVPKNGVYHISAVPRGLKSQDVSIKKIDLVVRG